MTKGILYYFDNKLDEKLAQTCREYIGKVGIPVTSITLQPVAFGKNIVLSLERSFETMFTQILTGLEAMTEDIVYFTEADVLYHPNHFEFMPPEKNKFYYNGNYWFLRAKDGFAIHYNVSPLSGLVAYREALVTHFRERMELIKEVGFSRQIGFEPMTHHRIKWKNWYDFEIFMPNFPNVDVTHANNNTWKRWDQKHFRRKPTFWEESTISNIPGWPDLPKILDFKEEAKTELVNPDDSLTVVIPARNEEFVGKTVENLLTAIRGNTNVIVVLDGYDTPIPELPNDKRLIVVKYNESVGQRAATNQAVRLSKAKYIMKVDAHCSFDIGFDIKMMAKMQPNYTMVPIMYNLHAFDWVCKNGHKRYQGPSGPCKDCGEPTTKDIKWFAKPSPESTSYTFDSTLHFQYFNEVKKRAWYEEQLKKDGLTDTMSLQGSCFMLTRDKYWELDICDEKHGSWGQQGVEVACKTWLSGGRVVCNHDTWYSHMFRTQGGDFGFPYPLSGSQVDTARKYSRQLFQEGGFTKAIHDLKWLIDKFSPISYWEDTPK